jgi:sugar phosphate isomerase/epimerase
MIPRPLLLLACAALLSAGDAVRDDRAAEALGWKLATKCYTFRALTLFETLDLTQRMGLRYIEINPTQKLSAEHPVPCDPSLPPELRAQLKAKLKDTGVTPVSFGLIPLGTDEVAARRVFDYLKDLGIGTVVSEPPPAAMAPLDRLCTEYGISLAIHNHAVPSIYWEPKTVLEAIAGRSSRIGACADTGHWARSGLAPLTALRQLKGHIIQLHFKDTDGIQQGALDVPFGTGRADVRSMLAELKDQGFRGVFSLEYERGSGQQLIDEVKQCVAFFDQVARELAEAK